MDIMTNSDIKHPYHHGDLRNALLTVARAMLEEEPLSALSLRAVTRRAGVSHAAPYRHFPNQETMLAVLATEGFVELRAGIAEANLLPCTEQSDRIVHLCDAYMDFVAKHPALTRLMFGSQIVGRNRYPALEAAANAIGEEIGIFLNDSSLGLAVWATLHGLAMLVLENVVELGQGRLGLDVLSSRAEVLLRGLLDGARTHPAAPQNIIPPRNESRHPC